MLFVPNIWPEQPASLQRLTIEYYEAMWGLTRLLGRVFALALGLEENFFQTKLSRGFANLRFNYYPEQEAAPKPGQLRAGEHTDYGMLTILRVEDAPGGLQVRDRSGVWHDVGYVEGAFVVNIGDLMARWTNDEWVSTLHRVVNPTRDATLGSSRLSIPFFAYPSYDSVIESLARFAGSDKGSKYPPITAGEYWRMKFRTALATPA
jgi:isopenicillin N synthase-like dioxygenase